MRLVDSIKAMDLASPEETKELVKPDIVALTLVAAIIDLAYPSFLSSHLVFNSVCPMK